MRLALVLALLLVASPCQALMLPCQFTVDGVHEGSWEMESSIIREPGDIIGGEGAITRPQTIDPETGPDAFSLDWTFEGRHWTKANSYLTYSFTVHDNETYVAGWQWRGDDGAGYTWSLSGKWTAEQGFAGGHYTRTDAQGHVYETTSLDWGYDGTPTPDPGPLSLAVAFQAAKEASEPATTGLVLLAMPLLLSRRRNPGG